MAAGGLLEGLSEVGKSAGEPEKKRRKSSGIGQSAAGKGREALLAGDTSLGTAPLLSVLGSHRFETTPGSAKIRRVKKRV